MTTNLRSMTGYGEGRAVSDTVEVAVEMKSVNHRFLDLVFKTPGVYSKLEVELSKTVKEKIKRGRVEVYVSRRDTSSPQFEVKLNEGLFLGCLEHVQAIFSRLSLSSEQCLGPAILQLLNKREVLDIVPKEADAGGEFTLVNEALRQALDALVAMRSREGEELEKEIKGHLQALADVVQSITVCAGQMPASFKDRLTQRLEKLSPGMELDAERLAQEVALLADRVDITEEIARLFSHLKQGETIISGDEGGRKLEFLLQEIGRELNTIGSKAQNSEITSLVIEGKSISEKLKEQVQNIE